MKMLSSGCLNLFFRNHSKTSSSEYRSPEMQKKALFIIEIIEILDKALVKNTILVFKTVSCLVFLL